MPGRFSIIPEAGELGMPYRSALHYSHRVIFRIDEANDSVYVVRVYHGARRPLTTEDIDPQDEDQAYPRFRTRQPVCWKTFEQQIDINGHATLVSLALPGQAWAFLLEVLKAGRAHPPPAGDLAAFF